MSVPADALSADVPATTPKSTLYTVVGIGWLVYWLTNSYIWMADVVPALNFYVVTGTFLLYFSIARPVQVLQFVMRPGIWFWSLTALIPILLYLTDPRPSTFAYVQMRDRIIFFGLIAGSGLVMADPNGPNMLRRAAAISLAIAIVVNFGEFFVHNPYNRTGGGARASGFYSDPNIAGAAIGTLLLLYLPVTKQSTRSLVIVGIAYVAILATLSRSGMLFATLLVGAYLFLPRGPGTMSAAGRMTIGVGTLFALVLAGVVAFLVLDISSEETWRLRSAFTLDVSDASAQGRFDRAQFAFEQFLNYFWTGRGPGTAHEYGVFAHNTYLTLGYEYGILGVLIFLGVISTGFLKVVHFGWARAANYFWLAAQVLYYANFDHMIATNAVFAVMFASFLTNATLEPPTERETATDDFGYGVRPARGDAYAR